MRIAGQMAGPIGLKFFVETYKWPGGCYRLKNSKNFFPQATPGPSAYTYIHSCNNVIFFFPICFFLKETIKLDKHISMYVFT